MTNVKFVDLSKEEQIAQVKTRFHFREKAGWFSDGDVYAGKTTEDVIAALIELEAAEINAIGDCMAGCCMVQPKLEDFVVK